MRSFSPAEWLEQEAYDYSSSGPSEGRNVAGPNTQAYSLVFFRRVLRKRLPCGFCTSDYATNWNNDGPDFSVPARRLEIGLLKVQPDRR